jgi:structure-specific recognition protein 1
MRFYVPNNELENMEDGNGKEEEKKKEKPKKKSDGEEVDEEDEEEDEEPEITPAKVLNDKIVKAAGLGEFAGDVIASLPDLPMLIPRGKYTLDLY